MKTTVKINQYDLKAELCKKEFFYFVQEFWDVIVKEKPVYNWHIRYLCNVLQHIVLRVKLRLPALYDLLVNVPPGTTKSTIVSIMLPVWAWTIDPTLRFITTSYSADLSTEHSLKSRDIIRSEKYQTYFPELKMKCDRDNKTDYENNFTGSRTSTSVGGTVTGKHGHVILVDDPVNPDDAGSDVKRHAANVWLDTTLSTRKVDKALTPTIYIMQRLHEQDCSGHLLSKSDKKIKHICLPSELTEDVKPMRLRSMYKDGLLDPIRLSQDILENEKINLTLLGYAGQYLQTPKAREGGMFQKQWFDIVDEVPVGMKRARYWDMAATEQKGTNDPDYTVGCAMGVKDGIYYIYDIARARLNPRATEELVKRTIAVDGKSIFAYMEQEPGSSGKTIIDYYVRTLAGYIFAGIKSTGSKVMRANALSCQAEAGNIKLVRGSWNGTFLDELEMFPNGSHDDQVDAASGVFTQLATAHKLQIGRAGG